MQCVVVTILEQSTMFEPYMQEPKSIYDVAILVKVIYSHFGESIYDFSWILIMYENFLREIGLFSLTLNSSHVDVSWLISNRATLRSEDVWIPYYHFVWGGEVRD